MCTLKVLDEKMGVLVVNPPTSPPKHVGSDAILERGTEACLMKYFVGFVLSFRSNQTNRKFSYTI